MVLPLPPPLEKNLLPAILSALPVGLGDLISFHTAMRFSKIEKQPVAAAALGIEHSDHPTFRLAKATPQRIRAKPMT